MAVGIIIIILFFLGGVLFLFVISCLQIRVNCLIWVFSWSDSGDILCYVCYASDLVYLEDRSGPVIFLFLLCTLGRLTKTSTAKDGSVPLLLSIAPEL